MTCDNFPIELNVELLDGRHWKFISEFKFVDYDGSERVISPGFISDFGSIPDIFQNLISPTCLGRAFSIHDRDYTMGDCTQEEADKRLRRSMAAESRMLDKYYALAKAAGNEFVPSGGAGRFKRWLIYHELRMWGWAAWNKHRNEDKNKMLATTPRIVP